MTTNKSEKKIKTLFHLADIHIPNDIDRYDEYTKVFEKVYKLIEEEKNEKMVVISGDLFNDKTGMMSYSLKFGSNFIAKLSKYCDVILIDGNHDMNMHNNKNEYKKISTIEGMLEMINELNLNNNIHYLNENKIYNINGINFGLTSMFTDKVTSIEIKNKDELYIGLYHGTLSGSKTDMEFEISNNTKFNVKDFIGYDIVMLGDIHKHQFLNKEKTIAYPSSLIQQNYGEKIKGHGLLKWDLQNLRGEFIEIFNEYCFLYGKINNKTLNLHEDIDLNDFKYIKAKIEYGKENLTSILDIEKKLKRKYNFKELVTYEEIRKYEDDKEILSDEKESNIQEIFENYINKIPLIKEEEKKELKKIIKNLIDEKNLLKEKNEKNIKLESMSWNNLFCYGNNNIIRFDKLSNINGIIAENGWGKSSLIDILLYIIYQKCGRTKGVKVLNKFKSNGSAELKFSVNNVTYQIKRSILPRNNKGDFRENLELYKNGIMINEDYKKETMQLIEGIFGSYDELTDNNILLQNGRNFIDKTDHEKKIIMYKIFGIDVYNQIYECLDNRINDYKKEITLISKNLLSSEIEINLNTQIQKLNNNLSKLEEDYELINKELINQNYAEKKIVELLKTNNMDLDDIDILINKNKKLLEVHKKDIDNELSNFKLELNTYDEKYIIKQLDELENRRENVKEEILKMELEIKQLIKIDDITKIIKKKNENNNKIIIYKEKITNFKDDCDIIILKKEIDKLKTEDNEYNSNLRFLNELEEESKFLLLHKFNSKCSECEHNKKIHLNINYKEKIDRIKKQILKGNVIDLLKEKELLLNNILEITDIKNKLEILINENINLDKLIKINDDNIINEKNNEKIKNNINYIEKELSIINKELLLKKELFSKVKNNIKKYDNIKNELINLEKEKEVYLYNFNEIEDNKKIIKTKTHNEEKIKNIKIQIKSLEKEIANIQFKFDANKVIITQINNIKKEKEKYERLIKIFTEDKIIEKMLKKVIYNIETIVNGILREITNFTLKFEVDLDGIVINKYFKNEFIDARFLSGYEKFASNIALRIAFGKLNKYIKNDFIIIDEGFSNCDHKNINKINTIFDVIKKYYKWCIVISHIDKIKTNFDKTYYINKIDNIHCDSQIKIE